MRRAELLDALAGVLLPVRPRHPLRVAVDGVDAAGKTILADELAAVIQPFRPVIRASIDRFHNPREIRHRLGANSPEGYYADSFDLPALRRLLLDPFGPGGSRIIQTSLFDYRVDNAQISSPFEAAPDSILLFDGVFLLRPELAPCWDYVIFVRVSFEEVLRRAVIRDQNLFGSAQAVIDRYTERYIPAQRAYLAQHRPEERANSIIDNDDPLNPRLTLHS